MIYMLPWLEILGNFEWIFILVKHTERPYYIGKWSITSKVYGYATSLPCELNLMEQYWIMKHFDDLNLWNNKLELINKSKRDLINEC